MESTEQAKAVGQGAAVLTDDSGAVDHFEDQAAATLSQWAALRRSLARANEVIDELRTETAEANARIGELVRANAQLSASLEASLQREGEAKEQAGWLKGIMTSAAGTLMEGIQPAQQPVSLVRHLDELAMNPAYRRNDQQ